MLLFLVDVSDVVNIFVVVDVDVVVVMVNIGDVVDGADVIVVVNILDVVFVLVVELPKLILKLKRITR